MKPSDGKHVAIVGAGPVGLTAACKLAQLGLRVACYDENASLYAFPRAVGLDDESLRCFQGIGIGERELAPCLMNCAGIKYYGERGQFLTMIHPKERPYGHFKGASFYQPELERLLLEKARALGVEVHFQHRVLGLECFPGHVTLSISQRGRVSQLDFPYVLGCDGSRSSVRKALRVGFRGTTFEQRWLVVDTVNDVRPERYAEVWCNSKRPTVTIPRRQGIRRWEFMLKEGETEAQFDSLEKIRPLLEPYVSTAEIRIERHNVYTFHARVADRYRQGRVFLAGDAAHVIPPFMAQGMAAGIRDADNLCWKLAGVIHGTLAEPVLSSYEVERRPHLIAMRKLSERAGAFMMPAGRLRSHAKDLVIQTLARLPGVASALEEARMRPEPVYRHGLFAPRQANRSAGRMFPQPLVRDETGKEALLDAFLGMSFALVCCGSARRALSAPLAARLSRLGCRSVQIVPQGLLVDIRFARLADATLVEDPFNAIGAWLRERRVECFLLRPDKYVLCGFSLEAQSEVVAWLDAELLKPAVQTRPEQQFEPFGAPTPPRKSAASPQAPR